MKAPSRSRDPADDDDDILELRSADLEQVVHKAALRSSFGNGDEALTLAREQQPDVCVLGLW